MTGPVGRAHIQFDADLGRFASETKTKVEGSLNQLNRIIDSGLAKTSETAARAGTRTGESFTRGVRTGARETSSSVERQVSEIGARSRGTAERAGSQIGREMGRSAEQGFSRYGRVAGERFGESAKESMHHIGGAVFAGMGTLAVGEFVKGSLESADKLEGAEIKIENVFGNAAESVKTWAATMDTSFGMSQAAAETAAGTYASLLRPLQLGPEVVAKMSERLTVLTANLAKARNADPVAVQNALISGLRGRAMALRSLGIDISATAVKDEAARLGLVKSKVSVDQVRNAEEALKIAQMKRQVVDNSGKSTTLQRRVALDAVRKAEQGLASAQKGTTGTMSDAAKTQAAYKLILQQTTGVNHAYADSSGRVKTQQEKITAQWTNMQAELGLKLMPIILSLGGYIERDLIPGMEHLGHWINENRGWLIPLAAAVAALWVAWKGYVILSHVRTMWADASAFIMRRFGLTAASSEATAATVGAAQEQQALAYRGSAAAAAAATTTIEEAMTAQSAAVTASASEQEATLARLAEQRAAIGALPVGGASVPIAGRAAGAGAAGGAGVIGRAGPSIKGLIGGAAVGVGAGYAQSKTRAGTLPNKALGVAKYTGYGAAAGSVIPGIGTGVGAAVGATYGIIKEFGNFKRMDIAGDLRKATYQILSANRAQKAWTATMETGGKAAGDATRQIATQGLAVFGLAHKAKAAGLTQKDLTNAITGTNMQYNRTIEAWKRQGHPSAMTIDHMKRLRDAYERASKASKNYTNRVINGNDAQLIFGKRVSHVVDVISNGLPTLDQATSFGRKNAVALRGAAEAAVEHARAVYQQTGSLKKANNDLHANVGALEQAATAAGLNRQQVNQLVSAVLRMPRNRVTNITVNAAQARQQMRDLMAWLHAHTWNVHVGVEVDKLSGATYRYVPGSGLIQVTASGGEFDRPQMRMIAEAGREAVVPLDRPLSQVDPSVRDIAAYAQHHRKAGQHVSELNNSGGHGWWPTHTQQSSRFGGAYWGLVERELRTQRQRESAAHHKTFGIDPATLRLLTQISQKLDMLSAIGSIGPSMARELEDVTRRAAHRGRTTPTGKTL